jgi:hypothetical protein
VKNTLSVSGLPQLYFDQLRDIRRVNQQVRSDQPTAQHLTRKGLQTQPDWDEWVASEAKQLDAYDTQRMFGETCPLPPGASVFHWVWLYKIKTEENNRKKARTVCDGSTCGGQARVSGHTYAPTPDITDLRLFFTLAALENKLVHGADVSNAFTEAATPPQVYYMCVDTQFREWWAAKGRPPIPKGHVIPILKNLQGHPEAPRHTPTALHGYVDSDWATDIRHRRSISGIVFKLAGAAIAWKSCVQPTVSLSSTEAEFLAASDAGKKMALYLRSILDELHVPQTYATVIYEDNRGALLMASAAIPTKQSRHIDIREYAILDWVERDLITLEDVASGLNTSDVVTKQTGGILFTRHVNNLTGRLPPEYTFSFLSSFLSVPDLLL